MTQKNKPLAAILSSSFLAATTLAGADTLEILSAAGGLQENSLLHGNTLYLIQALNLGVYHLSGGKAEPVRHLPLLMPTRGGAAAVEGNVLAVAGRNGWTMLYDVSNPSAPFLRSLYATGTDSFNDTLTSGLALEGNYMAVAVAGGQEGANSARMEIVDISNMDAPVRVGQYDLWQSDVTGFATERGQVIGFSGDVVYLHLPKGLLTLNVSDRTNPQFASRLAYCPSRRRVQCHSTGRGCLR